MMHACGFGQLLVSCELGFVDPYGTTRKFLKSRVESASMAFVDPPLFYAAWLGGATS